MTDEQKARRNAYAKKWHQDHKEERHKYFSDRRNINKDEFLAKARERSRKHLAKMRSQFLEMYGNKCSCCGESIQKFLTLEHIHGQKGKRKKRQISRDAYSAALKEYRPDLYDVLCFNCNCAKGIYGICPHKEI